MIKKLLSIPHFDKIWGAIALSSVAAASYVSNAPEIVTVGSCIGILYVLGAAFGNRWANLFGAALAVIFGYLSYTQGFFGNAAINLMYSFPASLYGLWMWTRNAKESETVEKRSLSSKSLTVLTGVTLAGIITSCVFTFMSGSTMWYADGISAVLPIIGTWLLINMYKEQWNFWLAYNTLEVIMWFTVMSNAPEMLAIFVMRVVFLINSVFGYVNWNSK